MGINKRTPTQKLRTFRSLMSFVVWCCHNYCICLPLLLFNSWCRVVFSNVINVLFINIDFKRLGGTSIFVPLSRIDAFVNGMEFIHSSSYTFLIFFPPSPAHFTLFRCFLCGWVLLSNRPVGLESLRRSKAVFCRHLCAAALPSLKAPLRLSLDCMWPLHFIYLLAPTLGLAVFVDIRLPILRYANNRPDALLIPGMPRWTRDVPQWEDGHGKKIPDQFWWRGKCCDNIVVVFFHFFFPPTNL